MQIWRKIKFKENEGKLKKINKMINKHDQKNGFSFNNNENYFLLFFSII